MAHEGCARGQSGVMNVVQRAAGDMRLAPHFHALSLDGVYVQDADAELVFHALPRLRTAPRQARGNRPLTLSL
ncbi:MAG: hypothetical protein IT379_42255 [Deltaproteobacteria bacterium]|nr:hypothetical protein [Deltaproteobacteria bacterium]